MFLKGETQEEDPDYRMLCIYTTLFTLSTGTQSEHIPGRCAVRAGYCSHALGPFWMGLGGSVSTPQRCSGGHPFRCSQIFMHRHTQTQQLYRLGYNLSKACKSRREKGGKP